VALFLVAVEEGGLLGCNGWDPTFEYPLGEPTGPAVVNGTIYTRTFASGTVATFDDSTRTGVVNWASTHLTSGSASRSSAPAKRWPSHVRASIDQPI